MNKRGQFFLIAALIIIGIFASMFTIYNFAKSDEEEIVVYDLSDEINFEGSQVLNRGVFNGLSYDQMKEDLFNLTDYYALSYPETDLFIIFGDTTRITTLYYNTTSVGSIALGFSGGSSLLSTLERRTRILNENINSPSNRKVEVRLTNAAYSFDLREGQNFFIILRTDRGRDSFVSAND